MTVISQHHVNRFWSKVNIGNPDQCWPWGGTINRQRYGYGKFSIGNTAFRAHRIAYMIAKGDIPRGLVVRHRCDNPACVNPGHLDVGTIADNVRDMISRNRHSHGERHYNTKLSDADVAEIRAASGRGCQRRMSRKFGISESTVSQIKNGLRRASALQKIAEGMQELKAMGN